MNRRPVVARRCSLACAAAILVGCAALPSPPELVTTTVAVPSLTPTRAANRQDQGGVSVSVEPVRYAVVPQGQEWADDLGTAVRTDWADDGSVVWTPVRVTRVSGAAVPVVLPDRVAFVVTVVNRSAQPFSGAGTAVRFVTAGRASAAVGGVGLRGVVVPPGGSESVTVYGPLLTSIEPGATVELQLAGVTTFARSPPPTSSPPTSSPATPPTAAWAYAYAVDERTVASEPWVRERQDQAGPSTGFGPPGPCCRPGGGPAGRGPRS